MAARDVRVGVRSVLSGMGRLGLGVGLVDRCGRLYCEDARMWAGCGDGRATGDFTNLHAHRVSGGYILSEGLSMLGTGIEVGGADCITPRWFGCSHSGSGGKDENQVMDLIVLLPCCEVRGKTQAHASHVCLALIKLDLAKYFFVVRRTVRHYRFDILSTDLRAPGRPGICHLSLCNSR